MSSDVHYTAGEAAAHTAIDPLTSEPKPTYRSWKKKFKKMKHVFDQKMRESDQLFREEQRAHETSRRLAEENDQLLDLLLDVNDSIHIPPVHRFALSSPAPSAVPPLSPSTPLTPTLKSEDAHGLPQTNGHHPASTKPKPLSLLLTSIPHTNPPPPLPSPVTSPNALPPTYLTPHQEDDYLYTLDETILHPPSHRSSHNHHPAPSTASKHRKSSHHPAAPPTTTTADDPTDQDRDLALRNPVSVYNWLRRHQPQVFLQDNEGMMEKAGLKSSRGAGKRASVAKKEVAAAAAAATAAHHHLGHGDEVEDGEGVAYEGVLGTSGGKAKRKRDREEDEGYRPRGPGGSKAKRKRESDTGTTGAVGTSGKKARRSTSGRRVEREGEGGYGY